MGGGGVMVLSSKGVAALLEGCDRVEMRQGEETTRRGGVVPSYVTATSALPF